MVPVMAISRAVLIRPMAMVTRPDAKRSVYAADGTPDRTADYTTNRTGGRIAFRPAALHSSNNTLSLHRERRGEESRDHGYSEFFLHHSFSLSSPIARLNIGLRQKFLRGGEAEIRFAGPLSRPVEEVMRRARDPRRAC
jgi:hypothetical protein